MRPSRHTDDQLNNKESKAQARYLERNPKRIIYITDESEYYREQENDKHNYCR
jgi:hypothetical protein